MSQFNIAIFDDLPEVASMTAYRIHSVYPGATITPVNANQFVHIMSLIHSRRRAWRQNPEIQWLDFWIDNIDCALIDYDLFYYSKTIDCTGSMLAYLLRCFTKCGLIGVYNRFGDNEFNLELNCYGKDLADFHIGLDQIDNPGLWSSDFGGYRPWYWPIIPSASLNYNICINDTINNMDSRVDEFLGIQNINFRFDDIMFLNGPKKPITFREAVSSQVNNLGLHYTDKVNEEQLARIAAARTITWLNQFIIPNQNSLIDAPHIINKYPSVSDDLSVDALNKLCDPLSYPKLSDKLDSHQFVKRHWLWRDVWNLESLQQDESIAEVANPWHLLEGMEDFDLVFAENLSRFIPEDFATRVFTLAGPPYTSRFLCLNPLDYTIKLIKGSKTGPTSLDGVQYVPQSCLSI